MAGDHYSAEFMELEPGRIRYPSVTLVGEQSWPGFLLDFINWRMALYKCSITTA